MLIFILLLIICSSSLIVKLHFFTLTGVRKLFSMPPTLPEIFDRRLYRLRRARAAKTLRNADFLHRRAMEDVVDRLESITREFERGVFFGAGDLVNMLTPACGVINVINCDYAEARLPAGRSGFVGDEEALPIKSESVDLIVSLLTLHHANDLIGALAQMRRTLKPDGLMLAVLFGENTLSRVKRSFFDVESRLTGGVSPRISPFGHVRDLGSALQRAGFALPVADLDRANVDYGEPVKVFQDLRAMGETSVFVDRGRGLRRDVFLGVVHDLASDCKVSFDIVTLTGWAPAPHQQKPLNPGSGKTSLAQAVKLAKSR